MINHPLGYPHDYGNPHILAGLYRTFCFMTSWSRRQALGVCVRNDDHGGLGLYAAGSTSTAGQFVLPNVVVFYGFLSGGMMGFNLDLNWIYGELTINRWGYHENINGYHGRVTINNLDTLQRPTHDALIGFRELQYLIHIVCWVVHIEVVSQLVLIRTTVVGWMCNQLTQGWALSPSKYILEYVRY